MMRVICLEEPSVKKPEMPLVTK
ncbi:unnamed protein product [Larinioides sclopetarius]|uniref:Uncharacterized protein n=1 Tax=Larinioides sclopetarius TaxID=280406 RepID=A0AAV2AWN8_9ARAC